MLVEFLDFLAVAYSWNIYKNRESEFSIADVSKIAIFSDKSFAEITIKKIEVDRNFRNKLLNIHRKNVEYRKILEDRPSIP